MKVLHICVLSLVSFIVLSETLSAQERILVPLHPAEAPVSVTKLWAGGYECPIIVVKWKNISIKNIVAIQFRAIIFDVFYEYYDTYFLVHHKLKNTPGKEEEVRISLPGFINLSSAYHYFVACEIVVFDDKTLWHRTDDSIYEEVTRNLPVTLDPSRISEETGKIEGYLRYNK